MTAHGGRQGEPLGVILAGGQATRLRPLSPATPKPLVPLLNRPLLAHALELTSTLGARDVAVVVGGDDAATASYLRSERPAGLSVSLATQTEPRGSADAVASVGDALDGRAVVVLAVDTVLRGAGGDALAAFVRSGAAAGLLLCAVDDPRSFGVAGLEGDRVVYLEEKPAHPRSNLALVGVWMLGPAAVERVRTRPVARPNGEADLTSTVAAMVAEGADVRGWAFDGDWLDGGKLDGLLHAQSVMLRDLLPAPPAAPESEISGTVAAGEGAVVARSRLAGPVLLGDGVTVEGCRLGPEVVVGDGAVLRSVRLRRALIAPGAHLEDCDLEDVVVTASGQIADPGAS